MQLNVVLKLFLQIGRDKSSELSTLLGNLQLRKPLYYLQFHRNSLSKVFFYLKNAFGFNHRENFLKWDLLSRGCCLTIVQMAQDGLSFSAIAPII